MGMRRLRQEYVLYGTKGYEPLVAHFGDAVVSPAFSLIDVGRVEISRRQIVGKVLFGNIQVVADVYYGTDSDPIADLTYSQYRDLQTDPLLKGSKHPFKYRDLSKPRDGKTRVRRGYD